VSHIRKVTAHDARFPLEGGAGSDAVHDVDHYSYPVAVLSGDDGLEGTGIALTLGGGNDLVCGLIEQLAAPLIGLEIEALMADFGAVQKRLADHPQYRWLGPHKGMVHLALASIANACFDLWAKARGLPLWRLLLELSPEAVVALLDLSYLEDVLTRDDALKLLRDAEPTRSKREGIIQNGYPGYDTSIGWFNYSDQQVRDNIARAVDRGFKSAPLTASAISAAPTWCARRPAQTPR
jgi:L-fuconate dehydratase